MTQKELLTLDVILRVPITFVHDTDSRRSILLHCDRYRTLMSSHDADELRLRHLQYSREPSREESNGTKQHLSLQVPNVLFCFEIDHIFP